MEIKVNIPKLRCKTCFRFLSSCKCEALLVMDERPHYGILTHKKMKVSCLGLFWSKTVEKPKSMLKIATPYNRGNSKAGTCTNFMKSLHMKAKLRGYASKIKPGALPWNCILKDSSSSGLYFEKKKNSCCREGPNFPECHSLNPCSGSLLSNFPFERENIIINKKYYLCYARYSL